MEYIKKLLHMFGCQYGEWETCRNIDSQKKIAVLGAYDQTRKCKICGNIEYREVFR